MKRNKNIFLSPGKSFALIILLLSCTENTEGDNSNHEYHNVDTITHVNTTDTIPSEFPVVEVFGCDSQAYLDPATSPYILPFAAGDTFRTGLTNCSESFHGPDKPDNYAFDFDRPTGTKFIASRSGWVEKVVNSEPSSGGGAGNFLVINHGDSTYGLYYHSPKDGIYVNPGAYVDQGDILGEVGSSGLAGYPHLHFIVVKGQFDWPYDGIAISFSNASPADTVLKSYTYYSATSD